MEHTLPDIYRIEDFANVIMGCDSLAELIDVALEALGKTFRLPDGELWLYLEKSQRLRCHGMCGRVTDFPRPAVLSTNESAVWQKLQSQRAIVIADWQELDPLTRHRAVKLNAGALLSIPLTSNDTPLGFINLWLSPEQYPIPDDVTVLVNTAGKFIALAMDNIRRKQINRTFQLEVSAIQTVTETLSEPASLETVFSSILRAALKLSDAVDAHIFLYDGEKLSFGAALWADGRTETPYSQPRPGGLTHRVARHGELIAISSIAAHPLFATQKFDWENDGAIIGIPLKIGEQVVGVMNVAFDRMHPFHPQEVEAFQVLAAQAAIAIANSQLFARAQSELAERRRAEKALKESEEKYRALVEHSADAIYLMVNGEYEFINRRFEEMFGVTLKQLNDLNFDIESLVAPESREILRTETKRWHQRLPLKSSIELRARHTDGHEFDIELSPTVFSYKGTQALQGIIRDVTERKRLEEQLRHAQRMESVGELAGGIAHNFNNILTAITALSSLALAEIPPDSSLHGDLSIIRNQADRAAALVKEMLYFSQRKELDIHPLDLNDLVSSITRFLTQFLGVNIILRKNLGENLPLVQGDIGALEQILANITLNARDAMPHGGEFIIRTESVSFTADNLPAPNVSPGEYVRLSLTDTGHGIETENLARIFDPFFTTKEPNFNSGLGLAMVFGLMRQFDGFVQAHSRLGEGTTISLYFPAVPSDVSGRTDTPHPPKPLSGGSERVLLLEVDELTRRVVKRILENVGYVVFTAVDGKNALELMKTARPPVDVVVSSTTLPDMTGKTFFAKVMALDLRNTPTFVFTTVEANELPETHLSPELAARYPVLKKPYSPVMLTEMLRRVLELR